MRLIIGGAYQGKSAYLHTLLPENTIVDGATCTLPLPKGVCGVDKLHCLVRRWLDSGEDAVTQALSLVECNGEMIFVCDELGCGVVPMERADREWRDAVGRVCIALAARAQCVERVFCGIVQIIQGDPSCG